MGALIEESEMGKQFLAEWGSPGYNPDEECVPLSFFDEEMGYSGRDIVAVNALAIGEKYSPDAGHLVTRIN